MTYRIASLRLRRAAENRSTKLAFAFRTAVPTQCQLGALRHQSQALFVRTKSAAAALRAEISIVSVLMLREWQFWTVLACAIVVMAVMQANVPLWYFGGDHADYYWYA